MREQDPMDQASYLAMLHRRIESINKGMDEGKVLAKFNDNHPTSEPELDMERAMEQQQQQQQVLLGKDGDRDYEIGTFSGMIQDVISCITIRIQGYYNTSSSSSSSSWD